jgi:MarR family transcriptional regulator, organic hydroperoxide resistance regulator
MADKEGIIATVSSVREKTHRFISQQLKKRGIVNIAPPYGGIFAGLFGSGRLTMGEIARYIHRDKSTVTVLVRKLMDLGYVETTPSLKDGRATVVCLTKKGRDLEPVFREIARALQKKAYKGFAEDEKETVAALLERIRDNL